MTSKDSNDRGPQDSTGPRSSVSGDGSDDPADQPSQSSEGQPPPDESQATTAGDDTGGRKRKRKNKKPLPLWQEVIVLVGTALVLALIVKSFFLQAFYIPSGSMENTLDINDRILVQKVSYWGSNPHRGDVVVFDDPGGWLTAAESQQPSNFFQRALETIGLYPTGGHLVKRVIAVGGDTIRCCDSRGRVVVNGVSLNETYLNLRKGQPASTPFPLQHVPPGHLWVMGDNRYDSSDSRAHMGDPGGGFVPNDDVVGKVWAIVWPLSRARFLSTPSTFDNPALSKQSG
ncbi:MAG: signal peptidase I [Nocardioidaceae bacterium]